MSPAPLRRDDQAANATTSLVADRRTQTRTSTSTHRSRPDNHPAFSSWILGRTPAARWGTADDLVGPAVFLAAPASGYVNGQVLFIDGGMTAVV